MGSASSVSDDTTFAPSSIHRDIADGEAPSAQEFSACAQLLASKYHDLRLQGTGHVGGEGGVAPPSKLGSPTSGRSSLSPLPRAERKRISRQLQRDEVVEQNGGRKATVKISPAEE